MDTVLSFSQLKVSYKYLQKFVLNMFLKTHWLERTSLLVLSLCLDKQIKQETVNESTNSYCFNHLEPETLYRISVHSLLGSAEGAAVSILHPTGVQ